MKKYLNFSIIAVAIALLTQACYKDETQSNIPFPDGNGQGGGINTIAISAIDSLYDMLWGDTIKIFPTIKDIPEFADPSKYTYRWRFILNDGTSSASRPLITNWDTTSSLNRPMTLPAGSYTGRFRVTDNATGLFFEREFRLRVRREFSNGYLVMNDVDGWLRLDMLAFVNQEYKWVKDVLLGNQLPPQQGPMKTMVYLDNLAPGGTAIFILTETGTNQVHSDDFSWQPNYNVANRFLTPSFVPRPNFVADNLMIGNVGSGQILAGTDRDGRRNLYLKSFWSRWAEPVNVVRITGNLIHFNASPILPHGSVLNFTVFDDDTKSIYKLNADGGRSCEIIIPDGTLTSYRNMGKDLVYFASNRTNATKNYAILKDAAGTYFHLRFDFHYVQEFWDNRGINAANISQAEIFAIGGENEYYIFFSVGGIIYGYNTGERRQFVALDLGPENQIGHMEFISNRDIVGSVNMLTVAYYNKNNPEGTGTVALYTVPVLNRPLIEQHKWTGMGKIVHVAYK